MKPIKAIVLLVAFLLPLTSQAAMLQWPVEFDEPWTHISSTFGPRLKASDDYNYEFHTGLDIAGDTTDAVVAAADGEVFRIYQEGDEDSDYPNGGNVVILKHHTDSAIRFHKHNYHVYYTLYLHLDSINSALAEGDAVSAGDELGLIGQSGTTEFDHLHFEVRVNSTCSLSSDCNTTGFEPHVHPLRFLDYPEQAEVTLSRLVFQDDFLLTIWSKHREVDINKIVVNNRTINFSTRRGAVRQTNSWHSLQPGKFSTRSRKYALTIWYHHMLQSTKPIHVQVYDVHNHIVADQQWSN
ncbi:MAG: M23 family metallopeptidase [Candidatus Kerfeldbacteria bacterium]|nr:M23 family metallopeptidase [Candidatus Kerfeldbacteria bacterium]